MLRFEVMGSPLPPERSLIFFRVVIIFKNTKKYFQETTSVYIKYQYIEQVLLHSVRTNIPQRDESHTRAPTYTRSNHTCTPMAPTRTRLMGTASDVMGGAGDPARDGGSGRALHSGRTGDLEGNLNRVTRELRRIRFPVDFDAKGAREGSPMALLPALHYALLGFSRHVTGSLSEAGHDLQAKSDGRFVENAWRAVGWIPGEKGGVWGCVGEHFVTHLDSSICVASPLDYAYTHMHGITAPLQMRSLYPFHPPLARLPYPHPGSPS